ncbi:hypothetical protein RYX36_010247, partial [Vicia faba]
QEFLVTVNKLIFSHLKLLSKAFLWLPKEVGDEEKILGPSIKEAFNVSYSNIYEFHAAQKSPEKSVENMKIC